MKLKKGDNVIVISGKEKGKKGTISKVLVSEGRVIINGLNLKKKHQGPRRKDQPGTIIEIPGPLHASKVMLIDPKTGKRTRAGYKMIGDKKVRIAKKSGQEI